MFKYLINVLIGLDQFANAILGGHPDMTISTRLGQWLKSHNPFKRVVARGVCDVLDKIDDDHCEDSRE